MHGKRIILRFYSGISLIQTLLVCAAVVAVGEIGDKTQLLALVLAARYRRPSAIIAGIVLATLANHLLAGLAGNLVQRTVPPEILRWIVAVAFLAVALWALKPDTLDDEPRGATSSVSVLTITASAFFLAEIGDKTQVATMILAARFQSLPAVVLGTTLGMLLADVPVVLFGNAAAGKLPMRAIRLLAAALFAILGVLTLIA